jgi:cobalt-zinc-cadmium efflux system outer membrane protein
MRGAARLVRWFVLSGPGLAATGCATTGPDIPTYPAAVPSATRPERAPTLARRPEVSAVRQVALFEPATSPAQGLDGLLALARVRNPELVAAVARVEEARGRLVQAGLYPNPVVGYSGMQMNDGPGTAGQQGGFVSQEVVTAGKLRVARQAAGFGVRAADWHAASRWYETTARVRSAYYEAITARAVLRETEGMAGLFEDGLATAEKLAKAGRVLGYDVTRLRVELTQARNRVGAARERVAAADRLLAVAVGVDHLPGAGEGGELPRTAPVPEFDQAAAAAGRSSFVLAAAAEVEQARAEVRQAELKPVPNVHVMAGVAQDYAVGAPIANAQVSIPIPVFDRNQGNVAAARARLQAVTAGVEQTRLRAFERLATAYQRYANARRQLDLYENRILPDARAAFEQVQAVYEARGERFFDTLDARRVLTQARIDYAQTLGDLWSAVADIEAITQPGK